MKDKIKGITGISAIFGIAIGAVKAANRFDGNIRLSPYAVIFILVIIGLIIGYTFHQKTNRNGKRRETNILQKLDDLHTALKFHVESGDITNKETYVLIGKIQDKVNEIDDILLKHDIAKGEISDEQYNWIITEVSITAKLTAEECRKNIVEFLKDNKLMDYARILSPVTKTVIDRIQLEYADLFERGVPMSIIKKCEKTDDATFDGLTLACQGMIRLAYENIDLIGVNKMHDFLQSKVDQLEMQIIYEWEKEFRRNFAV